MEFEYHQHKSAVNQQKHGIDFEKAKRLWEGDYVEIEAKTVDEPRLLLIGKLDEKCFSCIFTRRDETIRLISCRRSRKEEERIYHGYIEKTGN